MAWEQRGNRSYYYRKHRVGGRVRSDYVGAGDIGRLCADDDRQKQQARQAARAALHAVRRAEAEVDRQLAQAEADIAALTEAALRAAGYHKRKGQWRKKRHGNQNATSEDSGRAIGVPRAQRPDGRRQDA